MAEQLTPRAVARVIRIYLNAAGNMEAELRACAERADIDGFGKISYALNSSSRSLGAIRLANLAARAEQFARAGDAGALDLFGSMKTALDATCTALTHSPYLLDAAA